jgi:hypothetical protein
LAAEFIEAKRRVILAAEAKMEHFEQLLRERPRLVGLWRYWWNWYRVRRADWLTRAYLEQVRAWKKQLRAWENEGTLDAHLKECNIIAKNVDTIEDGLEVIETELRETLDLARERSWKIRYPKPHIFMEGWIGAIHDRYPIIKSWIKRIREELPSAWINFVYVIFYSYISWDSKRHVEAHLESMCINSKGVKVKVKELANKILRAFVEQFNYERPLLRAQMAKPPYEGELGNKNAGDYWCWGVEWETEVNYNVADKDTEEKRGFDNYGGGRLEPSRSSVMQALKQVPMRLEVFDFDYVSLRRVLQVDVPARWWELTFMQLLEILDIKVKR